MKLTEEELKRFYQEQTTRLRDEQRGDCLSAEELRSVITEELPSARRERAADHLTKCASCVAEYRILRDLAEWAEQESADFDAQVAVTPHATKTERLAWWQAWKKIFAVPSPAAVTLTILAVVAVSLSVWQWQVGRQPSAPRRETERGSASLPIKAEPPDRAQLRQAPQRLSWMAQKTEANYKVALYDFESTLIWESGLTHETFVEIPADVRTRLPRGQVYYWRVFFVNGVSLQSELFQFNLTVDTP